MANSIYSTSHVPKIQIISPGMVWKRITAVIQTIEQTSKTKNKDSINMRYNLAQ
jgi:hypothetical protein